MGVISVVLPSCVQYTADDPTQSTNQQGAKFEREFVYILTSIHRKVGLAGDINAQHADTIALKMENKAKVRWEAEKEV